MDNDLNNILSQLESDEPVADIVPENDTVEPVEAEIVSIPQERVDENPLKIAEFVKRYENGCSEIISSVRSDRTEAQNAIDFCYTELNKMVNSGKPPNATLVEALVSAIKVKTDINTNYIKALDAGSKLLSASKSMVPAIQINNTNTSGSDDLSDLLSQPMMYDEL